MIQLQKDENNIVTLTIARTDKPMNVIDDLFISELEKKFEEAKATPGVKGIILTSSKTEFIAGADLTLFQNAKDKKESETLVRKLHKVFRGIEKSGLPVVAAINGTALGGGLEICLACHYRIALDHPKSQIGLPEVSLGLLPGGGGTQRLPRLIGYEKALPLILQGTRLKPAAAKEAGLVDALATDLADLQNQAKSWILKTPKTSQPWDEPKFKLPGGELSSPKGQMYFAGCNAKTREKTLENYPAPQSILSCVYEGLMVPFDAGCEIEIRYFADLAFSREAKAMIRTLFFGINACNSGVARPKDIAPKSLKKIGILGAGMMGSGIAYSSAQAGLEVILKDVSMAAAEKGKSYSENLLNKDIAKGRSTEEKKATLLSKIQPTSEATALQGCDLIIEAIIEDREIKALATKETEANTSANCIFGSNTSTLPITGLAKNSSRPENYIGVHFFSPVDKMQLVEVILGEKTSPAALAGVLDYVKLLKKTPIVVNDGRGFYTSRIFKKYIEEGVLCLNDGISPALIENAGRMAGMPVGPLCVADEVSIDLVYHILKQTKKDLGPDSINKDLDQVVTQFVETFKRLGRKTGMGFYDYPADGKKSLWAELSKYFPPQPSRDVLEEVKTRLMYAQVLETIRCFDEKVLMSARDADVGSILGWGFPAFTGGTLSYIDFVGVEKFESEANRLFQTYGERFKPPVIRSFYG